MKFNYRSIGQFNSLDIDDYGADPPLYFEYLLNQPTELRSAIIAYMDDLESLDKARQVVLHNIHSIRQGEDGEKFIIDDLQDVLDLEAAIEEGNPDQGEKFIHNLALSSYILRRQREEETLGNFQTLLTEYKNGDSQEKELSMG